MFFEGPLKISDFLLENGHLGNSDHLGNNDAENDLETSTFSDTLVIPP